MNSLWYQSRHTDGYEDTKRRVVSKEYEHLLCFLPYYVQERFMVFERTLLR